MEINQEKLKIGGLIVIMVLMILISRSQHVGLPEFPEPPAPPIEDVKAAQAKATGTITGTATFPKGNRTGSVCAVNQESREIFCAEKVSKTFELTVPEGEYTIYSSIYPNPRDINGYRAYYADNHAPIKIKVVAGLATTDINPNDWDNFGNETLIAQINALRPPSMPKLASTEPVQPATPANPYPETNFTPTPVLVDQSGDSSNSGKRHKKNN